MLKRKTFSFALILMTSVMVVSLGILYIFLPEYYFRHKTRQLENNIDTLQQQMEADPSSAGNLILEFSNANNATVFAFNEDNQPLPEFFTPILLMGGLGQQLDSAYVTFSVTGTTGIPSGQNGMIRLFTPGENEWNPSFVAVGGTFPRQHFENIFITRDISHPEISWLNIMVPLQPIDEAQGVIISMLPYLLGVSFVISLGAAFLFTRQLTGPIIKISNAAALMREMKPDVSSEVSSGDELGQLSQNLNQLYKDLRANMESKSDFMRSAGHELKTPIAALSGMLDGMIDEVGVYKNREKYLRECKFQTERLSGLVNEIMAAAQAEHVDIRVEPVDLKLLIDEVLGHYRTLLKEKNLNVVLDMQQGICNTDRRMISTVFSNLLSNAVKYTPPEGRIEIQLVSDTNRLKFAIENETAADLSDKGKWLDPFYTPEYSRDKAKSGTGLGLYIVKRNLEALELPFEIVEIDNGIRFEIGF